MKWNAHVVYLFLLVLTAATFLFFFYRSASGCLVSIPFQSRINRKFKFQRGEIEDVYVIPDDTLTEEARWHYHHGGCKTSAVGHMRKQVRRMILTQTSTRPAFWISLPSTAEDIMRAPIVEEGLYYETSLTSIPKRVLGLPDSDKGVVVDVGANIGWLSLYALAMGHTVYV